MEIINRDVVAKLVQLASEMVVKNGDGENHTVAASIYTADGLFYTGINLYHFTGGPCAEVVALSRLISDGGGAPLAIVAFADNDRGVIAPCGRCRQVLADYCPDVQVVLMVESDLSVKTLRELIPYTYVQAEQ